MTLPVVDYFAVHTSGRFQTTVRTAMPNEKRAVAARHREWLRMLPVYTGLKLSPIAEKIKVSKSTLTRP